ncbi:hypothetical protein E4U15_007845 [Claviceps sp. LM218 group G6]|nr:hypothetical protein E4U15_007845 [Claviceps sp. LM218 group G6]
MVWFLEPAIFFESKKMHVKRDKKDEKSMSSTSNMEKLLDFSTLTDDISFRRRGSSFLDNESNGLSRKHLSVTLAKLLESKNGKKMRRNGKWNTRLTREYLRQVDKFRKLLLFCVHVTGGQPARGTEILSLRFKNGCVRVFLLDGYVMTVTFYSALNGWCHQWCHLVYTSG